MDDRVVSELEGIKSELENINSEIGSVNYNTTDIIGVDDKLDKIIGLLEQILEK